MWDAAALAPAALSWDDLFAPARGNSVLQRWPGSFLVVSFWPEQFPGSGSRPVGRRRSPLTFRDTPTFAQCGWAGKDADS